MRVGEADYKPRQRTRARKGRRRWIEEQSVFVYRFGFVFMHWIFRFWIRCYRVIGADNVPDTGALFLIANHTSGMDPFLVGYALPRRLLHGPGKVELFTSPFWGWCMRKIGMFPLRQGVADAAAVRTMVELYRGGGLIVVYPEGGRSEDAALQPFVPDFARLVLKLKAPVVPAGIAGAHHLLPIGGRLMRRNTPVVLAFGKQLDLSQFEDRPMTPELASEAAALMHDRVAELIALAEEERVKLVTTC